jgi:hypothetical protein
MNQKDGVMIYEKKADIGAIESPLDSMRNLDGGKISKNHQIALKNKAIEEMTHTVLVPDSSSSSYIDNGLNNPVFRIVREQSRLDKSLPRVTSED